MLHIAKSIDDLDIEKLMLLYSGDDELLRYLQDTFFDGGASCYVILDDGVRYLSALRLEPYKDGLLLSGFQTHPDFRNRGYGTMLLERVVKLFSVDGMNIYSHIHNRNGASLKLHSRCGFKKLSDAAVLLDGTVTSQYITMVY